MLFSSTHTYSVLVILTVVVTEYKLKSMNYREMMSQSYVNKLLEKFMQSN